jgi:hypothetical protein
LTARRLLAEHADKIKGAPRGPLWRPLGGHSWGGNAWTAPLHPALLMAPPAASLCQAGSQFNHFGPDGFPLSSGTHATKKWIVYTR